MKKLNFKRYANADSFDPLTAQRDTWHIVPVSFNPLTVKVFDIDANGNVAEVKTDDWAENKQIVLDSIAPKYNDTDSSYADDILSRFDKKSGLTVTYKKVNSVPPGASAAMYMQVGGVFYKRNYEKYINLDWFNPKADGVSDDAFAFQEAVDYLASVGGGYLFIPKGYYAVSHVDFFGKQYSNIIIEGYGANIIYKINQEKISHPGYPHPTYARYDSADGIFNFDAQVSNQTDDSESIKNISIEGIVFSSDVEKYGFDELSHHVAMHGVSGVNFKSCSFIGFLGDGVAITRGVTNTGYRNAYNRNVNFYDCHFDGVNKNNRQAISFYYCDGFHIDFCTFKNTTRSDMPSAIDVESDDTDVTSQRGLITNCKFKNIGGFAAVSIFQRTHTNAEKITHTGYKIDNCDFEQINSPLAVFGSPTFKNYVGNFGVILENSRITNCLAVANLNSAMGILFRNNFYKGVTSPDQTTVRTEGASKIRFEENTFENIDCVSGIAMIGVTKNIDFINNTFVNFNKVAITINSASGIGNITGNKFISGRDIHAYGPLITQSPINPMLLVNSEISKNIYASGVPEINIYYFIIGSNPGLLSLKPKHVLYGNSSLKMSGDAPTSFVGDEAFTVKMYRENFSDNYYPLVYQELYPGPNNNGNRWIRQSSDGSFDSWTDWKLV